MFTTKTKIALIKGIITKKTPIYVQYAVTKNCNLKCGMCGSSLSRQQEKELSLPEISKIAGVLEKLKIGIILLSGGEPFIRNDLAEIIRIFSQKGLTVRLQTNGILADEKKIRAAYQAGMKEVTLSLNSLEPEKDDTITGQNNSWHRIIEAIARFSQILPSKNNILGINTVVCRNNLKEIPQIIKFVTKIGFFSSLIPVHLAALEEESFIIRKYAPEFKFEKDNFGHIDRIYKELIEMKKRGYNIYNSYAFLHNSPSFLKGQRPRWHCDSPYLYFAISPSGNFLPCVDIKTSISMLEDGFVDLYNSERFKSELAEKVKNCSGCFYACWPEMTFLCRNPSVLAERVILGAKALFKRRKPVTYEECLEIITEIRH